MSAPTFLDLFCGCGGFSLGMERAGFHCLAAVDFNAEAVATFRANFPEVPHVLEKDLTKFAPRQLASLIGTDRVDVIAGVHVSLKNHRIQVEHELRAKLIRLRQQGAQVLSDPAALLKLCLDSVSTFCTLGRHALLVAGIDAGKSRRDVVDRLREALSAPSSPFDILLDIREGKPDAHPGSPGGLFAEYLEFIRRLIEFVDRLPVARSLSREDEP